MFVSFMPEMYAEVLERVSVECPETKQTSFPNGFVLRHSFEPKISF